MHNPADTNHCLIIRTPKQAEPSSQLTHKIQTEQSTRTDHKSAAVWFDLVGRSGGERACRSRCEDEAEAKVRCWSCPDQRCQLRSAAAAYEGLGCSINPSPTVKKEPAWSVAPHASLPNILSLLKKDFATAFSSQVGPLGQLRSTGACNRLAAQEPDYDLITTLGLRTAFTWTFNRLGGPFFNIIFWSNMHAE